MFNCVLVMSPMGKPTMSLGENSVLLNYTALLSPIKYTFL